MITPLAFHCRITNFTAADVVVEKDLGEENLARVEVLMELEYFSSMEIIYYRCATGVI